MTTNNLDDKTKHLEFIQAVISRMNSNSFVVKGWVITIVSAVLALFASTKNETFIIITALPIIVFWILDSFFLQAEQKFRTLYSKVIDPNSAIPAFSMDIENDEIKNNSGNGYFESFISKTKIGFYLPLLVVAGVCSFFIDKSNEKQKPLQVEVSTRDTLKLKMVNPNNNLQITMDTIRK
jgi:hypothetical protein